MNPITWLTKKLLPPIGESNPRWDEVLQIIQDMGGDKEYVTLGRIHHGVADRTGDRLYDDFGERIHYSSKLQQDLDQMTNERYLRKTVGDKSYEIDIWGRIRLREIQEQNPEVPL